MSLWASLDLMAYGAYTKRAEHIGRVWSWLKRMEHACTLLSSHSITNGR